MVQGNKNIVGILATIIGGLSLFGGLLATLFSFVDPVGLMFVYFPIPIVLFSLVFSHKGRFIAKLYTALFVLSHCVSLWPLRGIEEKYKVVKPSESCNEGVFIRCSETMFKAMQAKQQQTLLQQSYFDRCLNQQK